MRLEGTPGYNVTEPRLAFWSEVARLTEGEEAIIYLEQAAWMRPQDIFAHFFLAEAYRAKGDTQEAAGQYRAADVSTPMLLQEAAYHVGADNIALAEASLEIARLLSPSSVDVHHTAGVLRFLEGDFPGAVESFNTAVSLAPDRHDLYWSLGEAHRRNGNWPDATTAYGQATTLAPDEARYHYSLARAYRKTDRTEEAIKSYEMALTLDPGNDAASRELAELRRK
jgi:tetratricopeptide (TPR) repeat protein